MKNNPSTSNDLQTLTAATVSEYRAKLDQLEALIARRDDIKAKIAELDAALQGILGPDLMKRVNEFSRKAKRTRNTNDMAERIKAVCDQHPNGATIADFAKGLGVTKATASTYLYCSAKKFVNREHDKNGRSVWTFKG